MVESTRWTLVHSTLVTWPGTKPATGWTLIKSTRIRRTLVEPAPRVRRRLLEVLGRREVLITILHVLLLLLLLLRRVEKVRHELLRVLYVCLNNAHAITLVIVSGVHTFLKFLQGGCLEVVILFPYVENFLKFRPVSSVRVSLLCQVQNSHNNALQGIDDVSGMLFGGVMQAVVHQI